MKITIGNCSSPGASFTDNTNSVIMKCNEWINEHQNDIKPFREFRRELEREKGVNDNNARNIYPFLKNCGFISYDAGKKLRYSTFFTDRGLAYVKTLEAIEMIEEADATLEAKKEARQKLNQVKEQIIVSGVVRLLKVPDSNYTQEYIACLKFLRKFSKINKVEFGYLLYEKQLDQKNYLENMTSNVEAYRKNELMIDIQVSIRDDTDSKQSENSGRRIGGIKYLTAYSYILNTLQQGGIVVKDNNYYILPSDRHELADNLIKEGTIDE